VLIDHQSLHGDIVVALNNEKKATDAVAKSTCNKHDRLSGRNNNL
jgi:hypothetical protein